MYRTIFSDTFKDDVRNSSELKPVQEADSVKVPPCGTNFFSYDMNQETVSTGNETLPLSGNVSRIISYALIHIIVFLVGSSTLLI